MFKHCLLHFTVLLVNVAYAQQPVGIVQGTVKDLNTQELLEGVTVGIPGTSYAAFTDNRGSYRISGIPTGSYTVRASLVGYKAVVKYNINITSGNAQILTIEMEQDQKDLKEVEIKFDRNRSASPVDMVTPMSVQSLTTEEIRSNPGGNFDISRVVQVLPGVAGSASASFRNDIIIRGGAPNENVFYLDGIEIPVINHFQTQGSSGGPAGMLNVSFIEEVKVSSSAFDARYDNPLASVFVFKQRDGNQERLSGNFRTSSSEIAATLEGPIDKKTNFLLSARRSYLQFLFQLIDLPIRPNYWDFQTRISRKLNEKTTLTFIGVGAIDEFSFGIPRNSTPDKTFILNATPSINQWNYTNGISLRHLISNGYLNISLSRNMFRNKLDRFENKDEGNEAARILRIRSTEAENKLRFDVNKLVNGWKFSAGLNLQYSRFDNDLFNRVSKSQITSNGDTIPEIVVQYNSSIRFFRGGIFATLSKKFMNDRLLISGGIRADGNNFTSTGLNLTETFSPRLSASWTVIPSLRLNASIGDYYKIPTYTVLGFKNASGEFVNKNARYTRSSHFTGGVEFLPKEDLRFTVEGFYKLYDRYPVSMINGISLANLGGGFDIVGNEEVSTDGRGKTYGFEFYVQQKLVRKTFAVLSYTYVRSLFSGIDGRYIASSWDNRHLVSFLLGRKFNKGWELGIKYRYAGGAPYTPFDENRSRLFFATSGQGVLDFSQLNTLRLIAFQQLDIRIDKKFNFRKFTLDVFLDITNAAGFRNPDLPDYSFKRNADNSGFETTDGQALRLDGSNAIPVLLRDETALITPAIGFILEF
jgi:hypothetical protein